MKKWLDKLLLIVVTLAVAAVTVCIGVFYFDFISERIYRDSTNHLREIYGQVNHTFGGFVERNRRLLKSCSDYLDTSGKDALSPEIVKKLKESWGFSEFYFISADRKCIRSDGSSYEMILENRWDTLLSDREPIMAAEILPGNEEVTIFASPVTGGTYKGFEYSAVAVSYTNADLSNSLYVDAFSGNARCFVIHSDGSVLLSTQSGGSVFGNYLTYLRTASDLGTSGVAAIEEDLKSGGSDVLLCKIGNVKSYLFYEPVGFQDYSILSAVPQSVLSEGFLSIQKTTVKVLIAIFGLIGAAVIALLIFRSYRQSRKSETELQYREKMFDVLSNNVDDIFIMLDVGKYSVDYISPNLERLLGIPVSEARKNIRVLEKCTVNYNIVIPKEELDGIPLNGNKYWECEYMHQHTGERRWYRMTIYRMSIQNVEKLIVVMSDRTNDQNMTLQLREALSAAQTANEAKSNFLSNMSHDIRTPMNAIVGFSMLLEKDADRPDKVLEYSRKITASSHHLLSLINDVLDMSKIESGKTSLNVDRFSLPDLLEEINIIMMPQAKAKSQEFSIHVEGAPPEMLMGDKLRLNQILINLLSNAVKYTPDGGKIDFTVSELEQPMPQYAKLRFTVKDNGIGMSREFQRKIFAPFSREINSVTNKIQGTGLGMAITKNLVDLMGGIITLKSKPNAGSTFAVELSFALAEPEESDVWYRQKVARILVADDEESVCTSIRELMKDTGVEVAIATDGTAALESALSAQKTGRGFDVILLDWKMPGLDGVETARLIREQIGHDVPILVLTSYDWSDIEDEARSAGINAFMPKPFFVSTFWQTIKPLFDSRPEESAPEKELPETDSPLRGLHFLVAEDNELNSEILTEMLEIEGASCELAVNGEEAVKLFESSERGHFDMILMDVQMPVMNGYDATRRIRASAHPEAALIPIAAMTANTFAEDVRNALDSGMNGHLAKPIDMNAVRELVARLMDEKKRREE